MKITKSFDFNLYNRNNPVIIYGAGRYGEIALCGLKKKGITPLCFVDRNENVKEVNGIPVIQPEELVQYPSAEIIIASLNYFWQIINVLKDMEITSYYDMEAFFEMNYDDVSLSEYARDELNMSYKYINTIYAKGFKINHCELVLTQRCSLRCRNCSSLIPYYKNPIHFNVKELIASFDKFLESIDCLLELRLLGGEPFLYPNLEEIIQHYSKNHKVKKITIYTNSTVIPTLNILELLKEYDVAVHMSDYGKYSRKVVEIEDLFLKHKISYVVHKYENWFDFGNVECRNNTKKELQEKYRNCISASCYTFYEGKFYLCPRAAHGEALGLFRNLESEVVDFSKERDNEAIKKLLTSVEYLTACNFCNGSDSSKETIPAAIQE